MMPNGRDHLESTKLDIALNDIPKTLIQVTSAIKINRINDHICE
jgi:hypothetical protein